jgi:hypothetical protein
MTKDEISKEREPEHDRREDTGDSISNSDRQSDRRIVDEFEKIFTEGDETGGSEEHGNNEKRISTERDHWGSEYEGYEEW